MSIYKHLMVLSTLVLGIVMGSAESFAVPSLGVGSSTGYVNAEDPYQTYWGPSLEGFGEGFAIGASGSELHVFTNIENAEIYILTTSDVFLGNNIAFNGSINEYDAGTFRSYKPTPYYGIDLGAVDASWNTLPSDPFTPNTFYSKDVVVSYGGDIAPNQWIFAAADNNGLPGLQAETTKVWQGDTEVTYVADSFTAYNGDDSSPQTTSARGVPEPSSFLLLGSGLLGLFFGRKKFSK